MAELSYTKTTWTTDIPATPDRINNIEDGIKDLYDLLDDTNATNGQVLKKVTNGAEWDDLSGTDVACTNLSSSNVTAQSYLNTLETTINNKTSVDILEGSRDLNSLTTTGMYFLKNVTPNTHNNIPTGAVNGFLLVYASQSWVKQLFLQGETIDVSDYKIFVRSYNPNYWSSWKQLLIDYEDMDWTNLDSGGIIKYRKRAGIVWVRVYSTSSVTKGNVLGTLPEGFRPSTYAMQVVNVREWNTWINVNTNGQIALNAVGRDTNTFSNGVSAMVCYPVDL